LIEEQEWPEARRVRIAEIVVLERGCMIDWGNRVAGTPLYI